MSSAINNSSPSTGGAPTNQDKPSTLTPEQQTQREKKLTTLQTSIATLESQTAELEAQLLKTKSQLKNDPSITVRRHIRLLHDYNEIKDIAQGLMGLLADARGERQIDVQRGFGVGDRD
ncbi:putative DNA repair protein Swi5/Sae3 [Aspergillus campestris IBT 28561]|uniref:DNA repair protein Swi5/Sae3 n=1 Tax=Aspergillus campestris (strain IBT 28561) TaxID=1392248 RepID=A0A2I1D6A6_ASPC2|nr:putative DNA repair protein Swi5/Sae3 [Aspergillus campestris IBT 28561]PKY05406.1 putative DNA repair protein Swi5/Sae3 [Aspergillus campestris IBT 28561]